MRPKSLALLLLALGCGLVASIGITRVMTTWTDKPDMSGGTVPVVVAKADVGMGEMLTPEQLKLEQWPKGQIPEGAIAAIPDVDGRRTRARLYSGEPILENKLFAKGASQQGAAALIPSGYRLVTVKVDLVSGGGSLILPGDHVDVMVHLVRDCNKGINETVTRTILQNIKVFAVNDVMDVEKDGGKSIAAKTISLLVTPEQAAKVMLATEMGAINLVMRSPEDEKRVADAQAKPEQLLGTTAGMGRAQEPPAEPPAAKTVRPPAAPTTTIEAPKPRTVWTMRIIKPNEVGQVQFEKEAKTDSTPSELWKASVPVSVPDEPISGPVSVSGGATLGNLRNQEPVPKKSEDDRPI